jgi:hypothetical protein
MEHLDGAQPPHDPLPSRERHGGVGLYAGYNAGRAKVAAYAQAESVPGLVRKIRSSYLALRRKAARVLQRPLRRARGFDPVMDGPLLLQAPAVPGVF